MPKLVIAIIASLAAGFAVAAWVLPSSQPAAGMPQAVVLDGDAGVLQRLAALEAAVNAEREARQLLEDELFMLYEEIDALEFGASSGAVGGAVAAVTEAREVRRGFSDRGSADDDRANRLAALTEAGFSPARAEWIVQRESELRMEAMQTRYDVMRSGEAWDRFDPNLNPSHLLRQEIGDAEYEAYLAAENRPTSVNVGQIYESSPAQGAGLLAGDEVTHYDGVRVFSIYDLTRQTMEGEPGDTVVIDVLRNGAPMQVVLPRGPLGISARGGR